jgi:hypothetical protein
MSLRKRFKTWFGFPQPVINADTFIEEIDKEEKTMPAKKKVTKKAPATKAPAAKPTAKKTVKKTTKKK